jgi:flavin-dependent dehydrogenase
MHVEICPAARPPLRVAIVGGGPAGATLATLLARKQIDVTVFDDGRHPELIVGESLVPAVVPILRRLGVEDSVAAIGILKPGATFHWSQAACLRFSFERVAGRLPPYAYNVPRPAFDTLLLDAATVAGAKLVRTRAKLEPRPTSGDGARPVEIALAAETAALAPWWAGVAPDLIVDASGRARLVGRLLGVAERAGPRKDFAHFAHFTDFEWNERDGQVLIGRMAAGWSWRIPLRDRLSVGIVVNREDAEMLGGSAEERLERAIASDPSLAAAGGAARRISSTATYNNYQLLSERSAGPGWTLVGDAFGFVDPMLSPGVFLALRSAEMLAEALAPWGNRASPEHPRGHDPASLSTAVAGYGRDFRALLAAWMELIAYFYDGRLFALYHAGTDLVGTRNNLFTRTLQDHVEKHVAWMASGASTASPYSRSLLRLLARFGLRGADPAAFAIR